MDPPVIAPLDVVGAWSLLAMLNVTETLEGKCCCSEVNQLKTLYIDEVK